MNSRKLFAMFLVLALTGSALAIQQQQLYKDTGLTAEGLPAIQQHSVFVEIVVEEVNEVQQVHQFAAVVGLVKKCKQVRNAFDNAVLWFNDQFLFGNKSAVAVNVTPPTTPDSEGNQAALGANPNRTITQANLTDNNRNNGTALGAGTGADEGGNPDRDGFISRDGMQERWGGCYIPNGFVHAIGSDDPYSTGNVTYANADPADADAPEGPFGVGGSDDDVPGAGTNGNLGNIGLTKSLMSLDGDCGGCIFEYVGTFYITDPNNHRWMIDKFVYPLNIAQYADGDDPTNCHANDDFGFFYVTVGCGLDQDRHRDRAEDDGIGPNDETNCKSETFDNPDCTGDSQPEQNSTYEDQNENFDNHCNDGPDGECTGSGGDPTDTPGEERTKVTTKEPLYTVHLQVDPWNPDRQGFADEAIWAYRDGTRRLGMPYTGDPAEGANDPMTQPCKDQATVTDDRMEYDFLEREGAEGPDAAPDGDPNNPPSGGSSEWADFRRGPVGATVECAIEYNFLIAVDFEAFDDNPLGTNGQSTSQSNGTTGTDAAYDTQDQGYGENEMIRNYKEHGDGGADDADAAWQGNSHPHNAQDRCHPEDVDGDGNLEFVYGADGIADVAQDPPASGEAGYTAPYGYDKEGASEEDLENCWLQWQNPNHLHDAVALDLFFSTDAPVFVEQNPYWNNADDPSAATTGTPPIVNEDCTTVEDDTIPADDHQRQAVEARTPIVCDVDAVDGYHLHDGSQTPRGS